MSLKALSEYTFYAKYARYSRSKKRRETWIESVDRVFLMHERKYAKFLSNPEFGKMFKDAKKAYENQEVLGSQRCLQFGGTPIERNNAKLYNCSATYIDRPEAFSQVFWALLSGCGVGVSLQQCHISKLPKIYAPDSSEPTVFCIPDSIEGWADSVKVLIASYMQKSGAVILDYSLIRPEGSPISGGFKAPGHEALKAAHEKIRLLLDARCAVSDTLRSIDCYDILMHLSNAVLSGGVRRSALLCLFSKEDELMLKAKTGNWRKENPQRARSNNSVAILRDSITREEFAEIMTSVKEYGEPGFIFVDSKDWCLNPCAEITMLPHYDGVSGFQFCNLTEINGKKCTTEELFYEACANAAFIGTLQAGYNSFGYLGEITEKIVKREALLGCSVTGWMDNPQVLLNPEIQRKGAELIKEVNRKVAAIIGINPAARCTTSKPSGTASCLLSSASGIHPHHARRYFRRASANKLEFPAQYFSQMNPLAVEKSVWGARDTDLSVIFLCEIQPGAITKNDMSALKLLETVKLTQQNWVSYGTNVDKCVDKNMRHNVSNTISVKDDEWKDVEEFIFQNRHIFAGISLLSASGDKDYPQAPFCTVYTPAQIVKEYGDGSVFASGLIVDGLRVYRDIWDASDAVLQNSDGDTPEQYDWIRRAKQFAARYFAGDLKRMTYCLKDVHNWKMWCDLKREYVDIDWSSIEEPEETLEDVNTIAAAACAGGKCEII